MHFKVSDTDAACRDVEQSQGLFTPKFANETPVSRLCCDKILVARGRFLWYQPIPGEDPIKSYKLK